MEYYRLLLYRKIKRWYHLGTLGICDLRSRRRILRKGLGEIHSLVIAENKIIAGDHYGEIKICDMDGNDIARWKAHDGSIYHLKVTSDNKIVSLADYTLSGETIRVWDMRGTRLASFKAGHTDYVHSLVVTRDNKIVTGSRDGTIRIHDIQGGLLGMCNGHTEPITFVVLTPDGKIASGSTDGSVRLWDMQGTQRALRTDCTLRMKRGGALASDVTLDGKIVFKSSDNEFSIWDTLNNQLTICSGHTDAISSLKITHDNKILSCAYDGTIRIWDMRGRCLGICRDGTTNEGSRLILLVTQDNKVIFMGNDKRVRMCDLGRLLEIECIGEGAFTSSQQAQALWTILRDYELGKDTKDYWRDMLRIVNSTQAHEIQTICAPYILRGQRNISSLRSRVKRVNDSDQSSATNKRPKGDN